MITIVSGLPRSGTSLMMQMVEAGGISALTDGVREADENNSRGYYEFEPVKKLRADASWVPQAEGKVVKVIAQLLQHLPQGHDYRVVFMDRDLTEVLRSQTTMLKNLGQKTPALPAAILARTFDQQVAKTKAWAAAQPNVELLTIGHRAAIERPASIAAEVNAFLGGTLDETAMAGVVDPSLYRARG